MTPQEKARLPLPADSELKRIEIILLVCDNLFWETQCLDSILSHTRLPYKITVFYNRPNITNIGKLWNKLIKESTCDYLLFIDSDAYPTEDNWLDELMKCFEKTDCAVAVPKIMNPGGSPGKYQLGAERPMENIEIFNGSPSGCCFLVKKSIFDEIGLFETCYNLYGQESEWFDRLQDYPQYKVYINPNSAIYHGDKAGSSKTVHRLEENGEINFLEEVSFSSKLTGIKHDHRLLLNKKMEGEISL